jgi:RHH-type transcriptional regulator, proline utilization regulon repressor / proline dehydrogenase / delta 1-pyrroline-5-carboxylate dehydrogenase
MSVPSTPSFTDRLPTPYRDEAAVLEADLATLGQLDWAGVQRLAAPWVDGVRRNPPPFWAMESLLKEYPISSPDGLALMRLAEALLRVPDVETAMALAADQLGRGDFAQSVVDASESSGTLADDLHDAGEHHVLQRRAMARLSDAALSLSKKMLPDVDGKSSLITRLGARTVVGATVRALQLLGRQFVLGQTIEEAIKRGDGDKAHAMKAGGLTQVCMSYDMLGEGARTEEDAQRYMASYQHAIAAMGKYAKAQAPVRANDGISIKLSALHPRYEDVNSERVMAELLPRVWTLCEQAAAANVSLTMDAEEVDRLEVSLRIFDAVVARIATDLPHWSGFGLAMQAYQTRALELVQHVIAVARQHKVKLMCRLVKGAYWDTEIKRAQELGLPCYPVFTHKHHTDIHYLACAQAMQAGADVLYSQFATHNAGTIAALLQMAGEQRSHFELQRLHGMGEGVYRELGKSGANVALRVYAPVGKHRDLLAYLVRRLLENGANSSFVHQLADESVGMDKLLSSPLHITRAAALPLPSEIYGPGRTNSVGVDFAEAAQRQPYLDALAGCQVNVLPEATEADLVQAMARSQAAFAVWRDTPVAQRAGALNRVADLMTQRMVPLCALVVKEAHKTWPDAVAEVREAVDFLRYYANEAQRVMVEHTLPMPVSSSAATSSWPHALGITGETNTFRLGAKGAWVAISPWNFPLAIFTGQVCAALVTGNTVLAKPAEQTPAIAQAAVDLFHEAGVPQDALQLLHGAGETVGAGLVGLPGVAGVVFTGSTAAARAIANNLASKAGPIVPLIAETGGLNAMVVDSSALPEQVSDAVVQSAFRSAGQRCSATRILCVHEAVADAVIDMIRGATQQLRVGNPAALATDVGPLIDAEAAANIGAQIERLKARAKPLFTADMDEQAMPNSIAPQAYEIASLADVKEEIFAPVLQVVRWSGSPTALMQQINALGYGLTLGIHSRIDSRAQAMAAMARVGNVYINRNTIGAVVGLQPFGGEGLSGTGPKAGGPHYLPRFCNEYTLTTNTAAAGGNVALFV